ncbi:hypothetical protein LK07_08605 [Streptomyces pluripotens]|uniref:Uncharacterized protein n=1 Tax=Streptomyces pluripotens TaxID=1355015 RepID=A0A221NVP9_9ACTN|nr:MULTISPECIES: hypothetical protein [Streptomyces]ARP69826.1 hypothetical protein LK06_007500 [Streptomyces pluripotens]ASN24083.1 hypothetical protein LK07_08605 [Streptomyces pluripotens]KIE24050.1 hypothetical protein LK08_26070 [Streptomyces sp. MUSC 125]
MIAGGGPAGVARLPTGLLTGLLVVVRDGRGADVSDDGERALGRVPGSFAFGAYGAETAAAGRWS